MSFRSCPGCGFLVGLDATTCPLCAVVVDAEPGPEGEGRLEGALGAPAEHGGHEGLPDPDPGTGSWPPVPPPVPEQPTRAQDVARESPTLPLAVAALSVLAMVGLTLFGNQERPAHAEGPLITVPPVEVVAANLPTTVPAGTTTWDDPGGAFLVVLPARPVPADVTEPDGRVVHGLTATTPDGAVTWTWTDVAEQPWAAADGAAWLEAAARAAAPAGAEVTTAGPVTIGGSVGFEVRYRGADGSTGITAAIGHGGRLYRLGATGPAPEVVADAYERVAVKVVLP